MAPDLSAPDQAFPAHVFDALGAEPRFFEERIGGSVLVVEKHPARGPLTLMTAGAARLPTDDGEQVELAVEVPEGQQGAAFIALRIVCDDIATNRRVPPLETPWRNDVPFLNGTAISAIVATGSRWGASFDDVRSTDGSVRGHVRTLRLLTDAEAAVVAEQGWSALLSLAGSVDALLDVTRSGVVTATAEDPEAFRSRPVFLSKMHTRHPPRWVSFRRGAYESVTGGESPEYMEDAGNHEVWSADSFIARFPWTEGFLRAAQPGQTARFGDASGAYTVED